MTVRSKRRRTTQAIILALAMALAGQTGKAAEDTQRPIRTPLSGEIFIAGRSVIDPPRDEPRNTHAYLHMTGPAARRLFDAIKGKVAADACEEGRRSKAAGNVVCSVGTKLNDAYCDFSIDTRVGTIAGGGPC